MAGRIWYQSMTPLHHLPNYSDSLVRHGEKVISHDFQIEVHGLDGKYFEGSSPTEVYNYSYAKHRITDQIIEAARYAESRGFKAFILGSFSEPFLTETRSAVEIPVISMTESCALTSCSLGEKVTMVSLSKGAALRLSKLIDRHGLSGRIEVRPLLELFNENRLNAAFAAPGDIIAAFTVVAEQAIDEGADVVVPAEGVMNEVLFNNGLKAINKATVLDAVGVTLIHAEMLINLNQRCGIGVGRRWAYAHAPAHLMPPIRSFDK